MAITIQQQPTSPNMVNNNLLWEVTSNQSTQPQFQFVVDVYESGSATLLQRVKQQPNPSYKGVFDLSQIFASYTDNDNTWTAAPFMTSSDSQKDFIVKLGEEYGTSTSSSVTLYNGKGSTGDPAVTGSAFYSITNGLVDPYNKVNWNFDSGSYYTSSVAPTGGSANFTKNYGLSNAAYSQSIQDGDYATVALYNGNFNGSSTNAQDIFNVQITVYNSAGSNIQNIGFFNTTANNGGPRTSEAEEWSAVYTNQTNKTRLLHIGVGPQNLADSGNTLNTAWASYSVTIQPQESSGVEDNTAHYAQYWFTKQDPNCSYNGVRFAWKNEFGVWDYYTFTLQSDASSAMARSSYDNIFVDYSTTANSVTYDKQRRGTTNFYNAITQTQTANSDWLTDAEATWLKELFFSANVYIQDGTDMLPVVITSANMVEKTNPRTQKNFQYSIEFKNANQPNPRI